MCIQVFENLELLKPNPDIFSIKLKLMLFDKINEYHSDMNMLLWFKQPGTVTVCQVNTSVLRNKHGFREP
jgi:hypothetical protein